MKFLPTYGLFFILALCSNISLAQKAIVLINEQATRVNLSDGDITRVQSVVPGHMKGYSKSPKDNFKKVPFRIGISTNALAQTDIASSSEMLEPLDEETISTVEESRIKTSVFFDFESAILISESLETIGFYAEKLVNKSAKSILFKSWYKNGDSESQRLVKNRLDACRQYLETKGVASNIILTSLISSNREARFVTVVLN